MIGTIILICSIILMIFSYVTVPLISTINGYTIGMLFGFYSPLFYFYLIYRSLILIFGDRIKLPSWIKLTDITYWVVSISIIFISTSTGYYQQQIGFTNYGLEPWKSFQKWFNVFTDHERISAWTPHNTNGGIIGVFLYSVTAMITTGIGSIIIGALMLVISFSILVTGTTIGLYRDRIKSKKLVLKDKEIIDNEKSDINNFATEDEGNYDEPIDFNLPIVEEEIKNKEDKKSNSLPFEDPF